MLHPWPTKVLANIDTYKESYEGSLYNKDLVYKLLIFRGLTTQYKHGIHHIHIFNYLF
jgi:hypothetical protein